MKILYAASEAAPYAKSGGLADVAGALPKALVRDGIDCRVIMPLYGDLKFRDTLEYVTNYSVPVGWRSQYCGLFKAEVDGVTYRKKSRLTTILVMGVDHDTQDSYEYRKAGQADFLRLVVLDDADKTVQQLQIDRDTITPVTVLGLLGDRYEPVTEQICLGYAFGDGRQTSCEVTVEAVENLLGGQTIDQYLAMGLDGISTLNDLAGGVTVTLEDDFSAIDPAMTKGATLTLQGEQAETYVRSRRSIGVGTNEARMARQESYIRQLSVQLDEKLQKDQNFAVDAYDALQPYLTTSMAKGQLVNEAWAAKDYTRLDTIKPDGTYQVGEDGFMEFYPDADALQQAVLQLFYEKVE